MYKNRKNKSENIIQDDQLSQVTGASGLKKEIQTEFTAEKRPFTV